MKINVDDLGIDLLSLSGHKFYAPKGIGALYVRQRKTRIKTPALLHGGGHERGFRSGTLNVPGIVALGEAARIAKIEMSKNATYIGILRDDLETELLKIEGSRVNGNKTSRLFNTSNILFKGVDSDAIITALNNPENDSPLIAISNGSACTSTSITASHVLTSMGLNEEDAFSSLRFSIGKFNTKEEIAHVAKTMESIVFELRKMSGIEIVSDFVTIS